MPRCPCFRHSVCHFLPSLVEARPPSRKGILGPVRFHKRKKMQLLCRSVKRRVTNTPCLCVAPFRCRNGFIVPNLAQRSRFQPGSLRANYRSSKEVFFALPLFRCQAARDHPRNAELLWLVGNVGQGLCFVSYRESAFAVCRLQQAHKDHCAWRKPARKSKQLAGVFAPT